MTEQPLFITDTPVLPTLVQIHPDQARNMMELCKEMEGLIDSTNTHVSQMLKQQQNNILNAFKAVLETMKKDIDRINDKFHKYVAFHESDSQVVNAQNKMVFFRQECHILNEQCKTLKSNVNSLTKTNQFLENELQFTKSALFNQVEKNQKLKLILQNYRSQLKELNDGDDFASGSKFKLNKLINFEKRKEDSHIRVTQDQVTSNIRRGRTNSGSKKNTLHQISYNSVEGSDLKQKYLYSQQTRAGSLQKSICPKRSAIFDSNILESSIPTHQYQRYQSLKEDGD